MSHWIGYADNFKFSTSEFYESVEKELHSRQVPGLSVSRVEFAEGGVLSDKRVYLRMTRETFVIDVCAAPFGTTYFFSCRIADIPPVIKWWEILVLLIGGSVLLTLAARYLGIYLGSLILVAALIVAIYLMRNAVAMGLGDLDSALIKMPVIGAIYVRWIRKDSYHRFDTRLLYLFIIPKIVADLADEVTSAKGVKLLRKYLRDPILGELYKPVLPPSEVPKDN